MSGNILDAELKARVTSAERDAVEKMARSRRLPAAYILREALGEYFRSRRIAVGQLEFVKPSKSKEEPAHA